MALGLRSLGEGEREGSTPAVAGAHLAGGLLGGAGAGLLAWLVATPLRTFAPEEVIGALIACVAAWGIRCDLRATSSSRATMVPQAWLRRFGRTRAFGLYGLVLGTGLASYVPYAATYVAFAVIGVVASPLTAVAAGATYGGICALARSEEHTSEIQSRQYLVCR